MATATKTKKPAKKPERKLTVVEPISPETNAYGAVVISVGKESNLYLLHEIPCDFGSSAWEVEKLDDLHETVESYSVLLAGKESSCTCKGFEYHQKPCKHIDALKVLDERGQLPRLLRQKHNACPACQEISTGGQLCSGCETEASDYFDAVDQMNAMEAAGLLGDAWEGFDDNARYETANPWANEDGRFAAEAI